MYQRHGIFDEFKDAFKRPNNELIQLILINIGIFVLLKIFQVILTLGGSPDYYQLILDQLMLPAAIDSLIFKPWTLITYFFTHDGIWHIAFNMLFLYWFGKIIVEFLGSKKLLAIYTLGGITGGIVFILIYNLLPFFQERIYSSVMLGASAGVFAIVVGAATFNPNYTFFLLLLGPVRIKYIAIFYVFLSFIQTIGSNAGGEWAHLGGAFIGFLYIRQLRRGHDIGSWIVGSVDFVKSFFVRTPKVRVSYRKPKSKVRAKDQKSNTPQEEIDAILDKISESGYESLTKEEKNKLFNASKK